MGPLAERAQSPGNGQDLLTRSAKMIKDERGPSCAKWRRVAIFETSLRAGVERMARRTLATRQAF